MNDYISLRINVTPCSETATDLLAAFLADAGYESFSPDETGLTAFIRAEAFDPAEVDNIISDFPMECSLDSSHQLVVGQDWNEEWEKNYFQPIVVAGRCVVHSTFHKDVPEAPIDIVIDPKMAFGTGHHSTTCLMMGYLLDMDLQGKSVTDMGAGTGILSILAFRLGARPVNGIEIDQPAWENAVDNCSLNGAGEINMICGDASSLASIKPADLFLANINRNIILNDIDRYAENIVSGGSLLLSGFYLEDVDMIKEAAASLGLELAEVRDDNNWAAMRLVKK